MTAGIIALLTQVALASEPSPCTLLTRSDVVHVLHWKTQSGRESQYHLPQSSGWRCTYEADEGSVLVVEPNSGSSFLQNNDLVDPFRNGLGTRVPGIADSVQIFDNTIYVSKHGSSVSIAVLTTNGSTAESTLTAFARIVARRMP
jgi:hypothetical protein